MCSAWMTHAQSHVEKMAEDAESDIAICFVEEIKKRIALLILLKHWGYDNFKLNWNIHAVREVTLSRF